MKGCCTDQEQCCTDIKTTITKIQNDISTINTQIAALTQAVNNCCTGQGGELLHRSQEGYRQDSG